MALTCCFCGQTVGSRTAKYPVKSDFSHVMCADCSSALECIRSTAQTDSSYRNQAINYFRQKIDLGLVEPNMRDFLIDTMTGGAGKETERPARLTASAETSGEKGKISDSSGNTFWIIACRVLLILLCTAILAASVMLAVYGFTRGERLRFLAFVLPAVPVDNLVWILPVCGVLLCFAILSVGMMKIDKARDIHRISENIRREKGNGVK